MDHTAFEAQTTGTVTVQEGRLRGEFRVHVLAEHRAEIRVDGSMFSGVAYRGHLTLRSSGGRIEDENTYLRLVKPRGNGVYDDRPTDAAHKALVAGAQEALRRWMGTHPACWEAADCKAAMLVAARAEGDVERLTKELEAARLASTAATALASQLLAALGAQSVLP
jgi:hypothetical protein